MIHLRLVPLLALVLLLALPAVAVRAGDGPVDAEADAWERRLDALDPADAAAAYRLGLELEAAGRGALARRAFEAVVEADPDHRAARRALGYEQVGGRWLRGDALKAAKGFVRHEGRWMTAEEFAEATRPEREAAAQRAGEAKVWALLARIGTEDEKTVADAKRRLVALDDRFKLAPLAKALRVEPASLRRFAAQELGRLADPLAAPALLKRAIYDEEESVRHAVVDALREINEPSTVHPLGRALDSRYRDVRVRAAEAIGRLGDELGAAYLIKRWEGRSGDFPRAYFSSVRQISYIQDFDVEVAQTSFIADPIVGVLQEGVVQDVKVLATVLTFSTIERTAYEDALGAIAEKDLGDDVRAWRQWWDRNAEDLLDRRAARYAP